MATFWMTLWYAGAVVMTMGYEGQTLDECLKMSSIIQTDIDSAYAEMQTDSNKSIFPTNKFSVTCEEELLPPDEKYLIP
jgi:hypothetical protein